ncbi:hypothetical protein ACFXDH_13200 [Streptomyces sp. NPDC059467]|uniref:hypothetical protein n=1 Tax=Streptomyces sp. NPDC059467 TaxID=3346844 RepID=UPI0036AF3AA2
MKQSQVGAVPPERIRFRLTPLQRLLSLLPAIVILALQGLSWLGRNPYRPRPVLLLIWGVVLVVGLIASRSTGVTLTPSAAIVHNLPRRTVLWSDVQAIQIEPLMGNRAVVIYEAGGRRTRLRAPSTGFLSWDRGFEEKFHTIGRWWLDHRGPGWTPVPPPATPWGGPLGPDKNPYAPPA